MGPNSGGGSRGGKRSSDKTNPGLRRNPEQGNEATLGGGEEETRAELVQKLAGNDAEIARLRLAEGGQRRLLQETEETARGEIAGKDTEISGKDKEIAGKDKEIEHFRRLAFPGVEEYDVDQGVINHTPGHPEPQFCTRHPEPETRTPRPHTLNPGLQTHDPEP